MESNTNISQLLGKYFEGLTSVAEEQILKEYFSQQEIAPEYETYRPLFGYFEQEKKQTSRRPFQVSQKKNSPKWLSMAAAVIIMASVGGFLYQQTRTISDDLGTFNNPEEAFEETQKVLAMVSTQVNKGIQSTHYLETFKQSKNLIFKEQ